MRRSFIALSVCLVLNLAASWWPAGAQSVFTGNGLNPQGKSWTSPACSSGSSPTTPPQGGAASFATCTDGSLYVYYSGAWHAFSGGGGTPGGMDTQVQFNNMGAFGGFGSWDGTTFSVGGKISVAGGSEIVSSGTAGTYSLANSGLVIKNGSGTELLRLWASDPDEANFNDANLYIGYQSGLAQPSDNVSAGYQNVGIGYKSLTAVTTGYNNVGLGWRSLLDLTEGTENIAVGPEALTSVTDAFGNVGVGSNAGSQTTTGSDNVFIGRAAGYRNTTGSNNVAIGNYLNGPTTGALDNTIVIGGDATVSASNRAVIGNGSVTDVYFGSETPAATIHAATVQPTTSYKSVDGTVGATVTTCTGFKNGLCVSGT